MKANPPAESERALALGLAVAIERAMEPGAGRHALASAREAAAVLGIPSLDALLREFVSHQGGPWPPELEPVRDRLLRTAARCRDEESLAPFREAADEWAALAAEAGAIEWTELPALGMGVATLPLAQALGDFAEVADADLASRVRLAAPVAASLRAALDWLAGPSGFARPLRLRAEESLLEVSSEGLDAGSLDAVHRVIAAVDGSLGPNPRAGETGWTLRVPAVAARDHFLMLEQGPLRLAIPWHSVLRMQSVPAGELESRAQGLGIPLLAPLAPLATSPHEWPVITIGHGLRRGWVTADRLIWRLAADPTPADPMTVAAGLEQAVRTEEGDVFAVATASSLLGATPIPRAPFGAASSVTVKVRIEEAPVTLESASVEPIAEDRHELVLPAWLESLGEESDEPPSAAEAEEESARPAAPPTLDAADVIPMPLEEPKPLPQASEASVEAPPEPAHFERGAEPAAPTPSAPAAEPQALTALVVDDAIASVAFLVRTLEGRGFEVAVAERAQELDEILESHAWSLVLLDVDLPDASGAAFLKSAAARLARLEPPPPVVALVRDEHDVQAAHAAGLDEMLEKPVDEPALVKLLERLAAARKLSA